MRIAAIGLLLLSGCGLFGDGAGECASCNQPAGAHHVCYETTWCGQCGVDVYTMAHSHGTSLACERCRKEVTTEHAENFHAE